MKINNSNGISIVETLIALAMLVGVALTSSYIMTNTNVIRQKEELKATIDQIHILQVQRARNSNLVRVAATANLNAANLTCFDGSRTGFNNTDAGCSDFAVSNIPNNWTNAFNLNGFTNGDFSMFGGAQFFKTRATWKATCPPPILLPLPVKPDDRCTSIDVRIVTEECKADGPDADTECDDLTASDVRKFEPRTTILTFPATFLADQVAIQFPCIGAAALGPIATDINNQTNRASCAAFATVAQTSCDVAAQNYPMRNFGDIVPGSTQTCQPPTLATCGGVNEGYRRLAFNFQRCRNR